VFTAAPDVGDFGKLICSIRGATGFPRSVDSSWRAFADFEIGLTKSWVAVSCDGRLTPMNVAPKNGLLRWARRILKQVA